MEDPPVPAPAKITVDPPRKHALRTYRLAHDAWAAVLDPWCRNASARAIRGHAVWMVVANSGQARWIRHRALSGGISLLGLRFFEPRSLRRELARILGVPYPAIGAETLLFLLRCATTGDANTDLAARAVARSPRACLEAMDELAHAGWLGDDEGLRGFPPAARNWASALAASGSWTPGVDAAILRNARNTKPGAHPPIDLCVFGWDPAETRSLNLLDAAARIATTAEILVPSPRTAAESSRQEWIHAIETRTHLAFDICPDAGTGDPPNSALVEHFETGSDRKIELPPQILTGNDEIAQVRLIVRFTLEWLRTSSAGQRLGIVVPARSPTSLAVVRALADEGVALFDDTGEKPEPPAGIQLQRSVVRYLRENRDAQVLREVAESLNQQPCAGWTAVPGDTLMECLDRGFRRYQTRDSHVLFGANIDDTNPPEPQRSVSWLVRTLGYWPDELPWDECRRRWEQILTTLELENSVLEPLWSRIAGLLDDKAVPTAAFFEFIESLLGGIGARRPAFAAAFARVHVVPFRAAQQQVWDALVLADSTEGAWSAVREENPFLDDTARRQLNERAGPGRARLATSRELALLDQARFLDLLENCHGPVAFAAAATTSDDPQTGSLPSEWVLRCLLTADNQTPGAPVHWQPRPLPPRARGPAADDPEIRHLADIFSARRDPSRPFDAHSFNFSGTRLGAGSWSATSLDGALATPATFALDQLFHASRTAGTTFERAEAQALGSLVHRWLQRLLPGTQLDQRVLASAIAGITGLQSRARRDLDDAFLLSGSKPPLWWEIILRKAAWATKRCLLALDAAVESSPGTVWLRNESSLEGSVETPAGPLRVNGRIDLALLDRPDWPGAAARVADFKTGKSGPPSVDRLAKGGPGFQFAAYHLLAKAQGAATVTTGIVRPDLAAWESIADADTDAVRAACAILARLQQSLAFGMRGSLVAPDTPGATAETLPIAIVPVDPLILEEKWSLTHPA